jgi:chemotaxis protein CheY-P-specific phosphatase CheC
MNSTLTEIEQDAFVEIIHIGLSKAADALSLMTKERVLIRCVDMIDPQEVFNEKGSDLIMLVTDLKGDVEGSGYFIVNEEEAKYLTDKIFGLNMDAKKFELSEVHKGLLLELDNIISAAVITQLSDLLGINVYGDVPRIDSGMSKGRVDQLLQEFVPLFFKTKFRIEQTTFNPGFYWFLKPNVIFKLQKLINNIPHSKGIKL